MSTQIDVLGLLVCPAIVAMLAVLLRKPALKYVAFAASLPVGVYLGVAGMPSLWTLLPLCVIGYLFLPAKR